MHPDEPTVNAARASVPQRKLRLALIYGGRSSEHEVSLQSASAIYRTLSPERYEVIPIAQDPQGRFWTGPALVDALAAAAPTLPALGASPDSDNGAQLGAGTGSWSVFARFDLDCPGVWVPALHQPLPIDVAFPIIHGSYGEDGTLQGLLELMGIPYVGAGVAASAIGMDKALAKAIFTQAGLPVLAWTAIPRAAWDNDPGAIQTRVTREVGYPCFVKPADRGSSVGISRVENADELPEAMARAFVYSEKVLAERAAEQCTDVECAVLGNDTPLTSVVGEIRTSREFYDYQAKYQDDLSELIIPAPLAEPVIRRVQELSVRAFKAIACTGMARVDFFVARDTGEIYINEINTLPGFTRFSMYPKLWEASGLPFPGLLDRLVELGRQVFAERSRNLYRYSLPAEEAAIVAWRQSTAG